MYKQPTVYVGPFPVVGGDQRRGGLVGGSLFALIGLGFLLDSLGLIAFRGVYIWPMLLIAFGVSELMGRSRRERVEKVRSSQLAAAEERVRIARELHDIVAHSVSLMTVQIAAARRVFHKKPEDAESALVAAEETGRQSLAELRRMLTILRSADASIEAASFRSADRSGEGPETAPLPGLSDIEQLVAGIREAGMNISYSVRGEAPDAAPGIQLVAYRVVQESLTNALRHAEKSQVSVAIEYLSDEIRIDVSDDGSPIDGTMTQGYGIPGLNFKAPTEEGHGLLGMRERVESVGGSVEAGPRSDGGWRVSTRIPLELER